MGFVKFRKDKKKYYGYWRDPITGKQKSFSGTNLKRETEELLKIREGRERLKFIGAKVEEAPIDITYHFLKDAIQEYLNELNNFGKSIKTIKGYKGKLNIFQEFIDQKHSNIPIEKIDKNIIKDYIPWRKNRKITRNGCNPTQNNPIYEPTNTTINTDFNSISPFFYWCIEKDWITKNPISGIGRLKTRHSRLPTYYTENEIKILLKEAKKDDKIIKNQNGKMHLYEICNILIFTGLRRSEICNLTWENVNLQDRIITITNTHDWTTKTGHSNRTVPYPKKLDTIFMNLKNKKTK